MSFNMDARKAKDALGKIRASLGNDLKTVSVKFTKKYMLLSASSNSLAVQITVPDCSGKGSFSIEAESFIRIIGNRHSMEGIVNDNNFTFKSGSYKGTIDIFPYTEVEVETASGENAIEIKGDSGIAKHFNSARQALSLNNPFNQDREPFLAVHIKGGNIHCAVYDNVHAGLYSSEVDYEGELMFNILDSTLRKILSMTRKEATYNMTIGESSVYVESENIKASIAMTKVDANEITQLVGIFDMLKENIIAKVDIDSDKVTALVDNMMGIVETNKVITLRIDKKKGAQMHYKTSYGEISEILTKEATGKGSVNLPPEIILDLTSTFPDVNMEMAIAVNAKSRNKLKQLIFVSDEANIMYVMSVK